jgi:uroporphyrinogen decarboxylase
MTSKERFLKTIRHQKPDRLPLYVSLTPQVAEKLSAYFKLPYEQPVDSLLSTRISHMDLLTSMGVDAVGMAANAPSDHPTQTLADGLIINEWGMIFKNAGLYNEFARFPLAHAESGSDIETYPFPDPFAKGRFDTAQKTFAKYSNGYGIIADLECSVFETAWYLVGLEKFLMDLMLEAPYVETLLDKIAYINTETGKELIRMGADVIWCGDDFGSQQTCIMDMDTWRKYFKPRMKKMFEEFRKVNPDIKIAWHTCGAIVDLIPDFIEIGLDILNPIQPMAAGMDPVALKKKFGKDLVFFGGICVQDLLPNGTPESIKKEIWRRAEILGDDGGYIIAPAHNIQPDTPVENILALFEAVKEMNPAK